MLDQKLTLFTPTRKPTRRWALLIPAITRGHLATLNSWFLKGHIRVAFQSVKHRLEGGLKVTSVGQESTFFILITVCLTCQEKNKAQTRDFSIITLE